MNTINGTYNAAFESSLGLFGAGTVVLQDGVIKGGDQTFRYGGSYTVNGDQVTARVQLKQVGPGISIFNKIGDFETDVSGTFDANVIKLSGKGNGPIEVMGIQLTKVD